MREFNKETGPKPSKQTLAEAAHFARTDSGDFMAVAMAMRPNGATQSEIIALLGKPHRNKLKRLVELEVVKKQQLPDTSRSVRIKLVPKK